MKITPRMKAVLIPGVPLLVLLAVLLVVCMHTEREPLTAKEILDKNKWDKKELVDALAMTFRPQTNRGNKKQVLVHLNKYLKNYPKKEREEIRLEALGKAIDDSVRQMRAVDHETRDKMIAEMDKRAQQNLEKIQAMSSQERERLRQKLNSDEAKKAAGNWNRVLTTKLTPDERKVLAPISKKWLKTLDLLD